jgi:RNA polymerase sigma-70 factor, ECF subfamily
MMAEGSWEVAVPQALAGGADDERAHAFARLTAGRLERAYRLAAVILEDDAEAEDAVHDAGVRAWSRWPDLRDPARFDAWFDRIIVNTCRDRLRRRRLRPIGLDRLGDPPAPNVLERSPERDALRRALASLTPEHRVVVLLHHVEGLPLAEIAARTGEREGTVKSRLHYALRDLRAAYEAEQREPVLGTGGRR